MERPPGNNKRIIFKLSDLLGIHNSLENVPDDQVDQDEEEDHCEVLGRPHPLRFKGIAQNCP